MTTNDAIDFGDIAFEKNVFCGCEHPINDARFVILGAPFDGTASFRPGARFAPSLMRRDSWGLESYSPQLDHDLEEAAVADAGDLEMPYGDAKAAIKIVKEAVSALLNEKKIPVMIGGDHSLTTGAIEAALAHYPELHLIHFDAHTDLRPDYMGDPWSHASVMRRCYDLLGGGRIHSFGIRSGLKGEFLFAKEHLDFHPFHLEGVENLKALVGDAPVYVTIDLDVLDPSEMPGTGTPEAGGVSFQELLKALAHVSELKVIGTDMMELSPPLDLSGASTALACKLLREWLLLLDLHRS